MVNSPNILAFEKVADPHKVCMLVPYEGNLIFVVRQHKDGRVSVEPPGGKRDPLVYGRRIESPEEALVREAHEELGIKIRPLDRLGVEAHPFTGAPVGYYYCEHVSGVPYNIETRQHLQVIEVSAGRTSMDDFRRACSMRRVAGVPVEFRLPENVYESYLKRVGDDTIPTFPIPRPADFIPKRA